MHGEDILEVRPMEVDVAKELLVKKLKKEEEGQLWRTWCSWLGSLPST